MRRSAQAFCAVFFFLLLDGAGRPVSAQEVESVGSRALGMGGAFVAVANDSSATWWNPAGLAAGPFLDVAIARTAASVDDRLPAGRRGIWSFALATPPFGLSYYRLRLTEIRPLDPTAEAGAGREDRRAGVAVRSLSASQFGATILHTLATGIHVGTTVKYVRGTARAADLGGTEAALLRVPDLLDRADELAGGDADGGLDLDAGVLAVAGAFRVGGLVRNVREQAFDGMRLPRQVRVGAAYDAEALGGRPLLVSLDADVRAYASAAGERRVIATGAEHWFRARRVGVRGGARVNTAGAGDLAVTAGATVSPRPGMFVDGHVVRGGNGGEDGWGIAARVSF